VYKNELEWKSEADIENELMAIWRVMKEAILKGISTEGELPGGLHVQRRAKDLYEQFKSTEGDTPSLTSIIDHLSTYAIAVNEENAAGGRVVTAPTNGAAGVIPSVLYYVDQCMFPITYNELKIFFMTAGGICHLFKENASISGAEMGCQGEVGVASAMAAAGLTALKGGTPIQIECAAEIAMEHHLGLTCDPIKGLVQVPCIERNSMGAIKAVTACELALKRTQGYRKISLDKVIRTMKRTGEDMNRAYKETSLGGLAVEC
jgi:L-serine dehydratase